jgi:cytochrome c biogenesis protein CcmG/thiol:disulfide interchange protein DsbE
VLTGDTEGASLDYGVVKLPESYVIDPNGTVVAKLDGGVTADELQAVIDGRTP